MPSSPKQVSANQPLVEDVDQWSEALIVKPEVAASVIWPKESPAAGCRQLYQNPNVFIQVGPT